MPVTAITARTPIAGTVNGELAVMLGTSVRLILQASVDAYSDEELGAHRDIRLRATVQVNGVKTRQAGDGPPTNKLHSPLLQRIPGARCILHSPSRVTVD
jgi:hypothetical protein